MLEVKKFRSVEFRIFSYPSLVRFVLGVSLRHFFRVPTINALIENEKVHFYLFTRGYSYALTILFNIMHIYKYNLCLTSKKCRSQ